MVNLANLYFQHWTIFTNISHTYTQNLKCVSNWKGGVVLRIIGIAVNHINIHIPHM